MPQGKKRPTDVDYRNNHAILEREIAEQGLVECYDEPTDEELQKLDAQLRGLRKLRKKKR